ncbi:UDP-N-acetylmuramoyl-L-alanine--D-glutamate ligase [uncultured Ruminococcus sp.]|uniref:UDP-N-acetylmuramoyl-L-alanine--D-glutamate ligase n=1 Tax=uncultured Ruminococcus sp. TaxID=165186 RepID=UPI00266ED533|nr:UDP-N-acetylmuramoyl-L-alanine--D-glutamate ligase [uncultured Ruminococcus sp.]
MNHNITRFFEQMKQSRVAFIGTGVTNGDIIRLFRKKGIEVTLLDRKTADKLGAAYDEFKALGVQFCLGDAYLDRLTDYDVVFRSPGMYYHNEKLQQARAQGVVITSEMEVFFQLCPCKIYAVTGSDGKTTTTTLISEFLSRAGYRVHKGGNIGRALLPIIDDIREEDVAVVELSSFQLLSMRQSPDVAVITNIAPNHLDVHGTMEEYIYAKTNLIAHQDAFSRTILNQDNEATMNLASMVRGTLTTFSRKTQPAFGTFLREDGMLCYVKNGEVTPVVHKDDIRIPGMHNVENYLAAINAVWGTVSIEDIVYVAKNFGGVEHRIEFVRELDGVKWYNDSIATSPTRVLAGLRSFSQKLIVIMGGYDKKIPFEPMADTVCQQVKLVLLMGVTADKIEKAIRGSQYYQDGAPELVHVSSMEEAVQEARKRAKAGDIVTLSPACASFDLYPNFEARGIHYKNLVKELH